MKQRVGLMLAAGIAVGCSNAGSSPSDSSSPSGSNEVEVSETVVFEGSKFSGYELRVWLSAGAPSDLEAIDRVEVTSASFSGAGEGGTTSGAAKPSCPLSIQKTAPSSGGGKGATALPYLSLMLLTAFADTTTAQLVVSSGCGIVIGPALRSNNKEPKTIRILGTRATGARFTVQFSTPF